MSTNQGDFEPVAKRFDVDNPKHNRNWKALATHLRTNFVSNANLQDGSITTAKIGDLQVTNAKIESLVVDKLTAGTLSADVVLGATIKTAESGQRVEIDVNGIRLNDGTADVVNIPVSGTASFSGGINATSLSSAGTTLSGSTLIDAGGSFVFAAGLADPSVAPTVAWVYDETALSGGVPSTVRGIGWDSTDNQLLVCGPTDYKIYGYDNSTGAQNWNVDLRQFVGFGSEIDLKPYGITRVGSNIFVASIDGRGSSTKVYLQKWGLTAGEPTSLLTEVTANLSPQFTNFSHLAGMTNDGTDIYVGFVKATGDVCVSKWSTSLVFSSITTLDAAFETGDRFVWDVSYANIDGGRWWVVFGNSVTGVYRVNAYTSAPAGLAAENFDLPNDSRGVTFDGTDFVTTPASAAKFRTHTEWRSSQTVEHVKYTWHHTTPYETVASSQAHITYVQRAKLRVSWPSLPGAADSARVYMLENNVTTNPSTGAMKLQGTETGTSQEYVTYNSGGAADPSSTTFPATTPSIFVLPTKSSAPSSPVEGQIYHNTTTHKTQVYDGTSWNNLW